VISGRTVGAVAVGVLLAGGLGACATSITGSATPAVTLPATTAPAGGGSTPPSPTPGADLSPQAQQTCGLLPKGSVTTAFGVPDVTVTAVTGTPPGSGIQQVNCVITSTNGFRATVVVQIYPAGTISTADQYYQVMQRRFTSLQKLNGITGADTAGLFQDNETGAPVDEAFAATKDTKTNTVGVVLAAVPDSPGITTKLVTFITALAKP
jgi:hypothetical protein